jgi:hypothetical protein
MSSVPTCSLCGAVIGAYEPAIVVNAQVVQRISRAAHRFLGTVEGRPYHVACYELGVHGVAEPAHAPGV